MLQRRLGALVVFVGRQHSLAIGIALVGAVHGDVVVIVLAEGEVAFGGAAGIAHDACGIIVIRALVEAVGNDPGFQGVFAGTAQGVEQFPAAADRCLGAAAVRKFNAPSTAPGDIANQVEVGYRVYA